MFCKIVEFLAVYAISSGKIFNQNNEAKEPRREKSSAPDKRGNNYFSFSDTPISYDPDDDDDD